MPRGVTEGKSWLPLLGRVEWMSETQPEERPRAVVVKGEWRPVETLETHKEGPAVAGGAVVTVFLARDAEGRRYRIRATGHAQARVEIEVG